MRIPTYLYLPGISGWDEGAINRTIQSFEQAKWNAQDALADCRDYASDLEADVAYWQARDQQLVDRINNDLIPRIQRMAERERELVASLGRMQQAGADLTTSVKKGLEPRIAQLEGAEQALVDRINKDLLPRLAHLEKREAELLAWGKALKARIDDKHLPRIKALEAREAELVGMVNAHAKRINDSLIPEVATLREGRKAMQEEAARAAEREKALEAQVAALTGENERLRGDLVVARHELADADDAGRALRDEVDSLEREAHERQQEGTPALASGP